MMIMFALSHKNCSCSIFELQFFGVKECVRFCLFLNIVIMVIFLKVVMIMLDSH